MIKNYFRTAWRNLWKNKTFSLINIAGLAIGMAACLLILQYVSFKLSFDQFNKNAADLYRVYNDRYQNGKFSKVFGRSVLMGTDSIPYKVTGVCKNVPENSHLQFDILAAYSTLYAGNNSNPYKEADYDFTDSDFWHYIQLKHGTDYKKLQAKFPAFSQRHFQGTKVSGTDEKFYLQPLSKAHLYSDFEYEIGRTGSATTVWGLLIIAALIIVIAWVNYINLATAKSMERAKEVGVRKVSGATKQQLIRQFLSESFMINVIALVLALLMVTLVRRGFNNMI